MSKRKFVKLLSIITVLLMVFMPLPAFAANTARSFRLTTNLTALKKTSEIWFDEYSGTKYNDAQCSVDTKKFLERYGDIAYSIDENIELTPKPTDPDENTYTYEFINISLSDKNKVISKDGSISVNVNKSENDYNIIVTFDIINASGFVGSIMSYSSIYMIIGGLMIMILVPSCIWVHNKYSSSSSSSDSSSGGDWHFI